MAEGNSVSEESSLSRSDGAEDPRLRRIRLSGRSLAFVILALAVALGLGYWAVSWLVTTDQRSAETQSRALERSWQDAQGRAAQGVDFELKLTAPESSGSTSMSFSHGGSVRAEDSCFEASSEYIVLEDGSLAVRDLTDVSRLSSEPGCASASPSSIFSSSRLSFKASSWVATGPSGQPLMSGLIEER